MSPALPPWLPRLDGQLAVVTGANSGIGFQAARMLAGAGATVVLACRRPDAAGEAADLLRTDFPDAALRTVSVDLASQSSIESGTRQLKDLLDRPIDLLINNAGVMAPPTRRVTEDGFELQLGVNHLGHFAWTMRLVDTLSDRARVVQVSSIAHRIGHMNWDDLHSVRSYNAWTTYGQSKLANLLFMAELDRRLEERGTGPRAMACHPGYSATNLQTAFDADRSIENRVKRLGNAILAQSAAAGAQPTLYAATSKHVHGGDYVGPATFFEMWGPPVKVGRSKAARDRTDQARLWEESVKLTGLDLP
jgi:NAD(P)-dependent dehydrogenase (short-subunit alcohol dehydrogenase family)